MPPPDARPIGTPDQHERLGRLTADDFIRLAQEDGLSGNERSGFPDAFRQGRDGVLMADIRMKVPALDTPGATIVDIGLGCSDLAFALRRHCEADGRRLVAVDAPEVLAHHPPGPAFVPVPGRFPHADPRAVVGMQGAEGIIAYSVLQYLKDDESASEFVVAAAALLAPGGQLLIGDIPNRDMRSRFIDSAAGREYNRRLWGHDAPPPSVVQDDGPLTDAFLLDLVRQLRAQGVHAWLAPQSPALPMANRREDLIVHRP